MISRKLVTLIFLLGTSTMAYGALKQPSVVYRARLFKKEYTSEQEIEGLKKTLTDIYQQKGPTQAFELWGSLENYNNHRIKDKAQEIKFLDTIIPALFLGQDTIKGGNGYSQESWLKTIRPNTYLMNLLLYNHNAKIPIACQMPAKEKHLMGIQNPSGFYMIEDLYLLISVLKMEETMWAIKDAQESIDYCKAIITPPASFGQKDLATFLNKDRTVITLLMCLKRLKLQNPSSFNLPRVVVNNCVLPLVAQNCDSEEMQQACERVKKNVQELIAFFKEQTIPENASGATAFLYNDFEAWAQEHMNPKIIMGKALAQHIQSFAQKKEPVKQNTSIN